MEKTLIGAGELARWGASVRPWAVVASVHTLWTRAWAGPAAATAPTWLSSLFGTCSFTGWACHQHSPYELKTVRGRASCGVKGTRAHCTSRWRGKGPWVWAVGEKTTEAGWPWLLPPHLHLSPRGACETVAHPWAPDTGPGHQPQGSDKEICILPGSPGDPYAHQSLGVPAV